MGVILSGAIDTEPEVRQVLIALQKLSYLEKTVIEEDSAKIFAAFQEWKAKNNIEGCVDTPREIQILLEWLKQDGRLSGTIETQEEKKIQVLEHLQKEGVLQSSFANARKMDNLKETNEKMDDIKEANEEKGPSPARRR